ncbi:MAG TPA: chemotaxis protein CheW [Polyangiaceae bacterium]|jgi:purine-binding chemotaxis protein CheW|nr:chemotaxis protein CheW [Polyangiaceae bacterium]
MRSRAKGVSDPSRSLVGFTVGNAWYAVPIRHVREITHPMPVTALPKSSPVVIGMADHRGEVVTIVDLRIHFGLPERNAAERTKWILLQLAGEPVGLVVDSVTEVFGTQGEPLREAPHAARAAEQGILGVLSRHERLVFVIDVERFVSLVRSIRPRASLPEVSE